MIVKYPCLLGCSITKNLDPKVSFLRENLGASIDDLRAALVSCPSLLGYSLERRIRPRVSVLLERKISPEFSQHKWMLTVASDAKFLYWLRNT